MAVYKVGSTGEQVKQIQKALGLKADGIFGRGTESAVKKFQKENGLYVDGKVGEKTLAKLILKRIIYYLVTRINIQMKLIIIKQNILKI